MIFGRVGKIYKEYPHHFWVVIGALFIDQLGGALIFPFIALFLTAKFHVGMTEVGQLLAIIFTTSILGGIVGGAMTDKFGRKNMIILGLVISALTILLLGLVDDLNLIYLLGIVVGLFANIGGPAQQAIIADILPEEKRADGFGILRIMANLAVTIGPAIGGLLATQSYLWLFILDAVASTVTASVVYLIVRETRPATPADRLDESILHTVKGYSQIAKDGLYISFIVISTLMVSAYVQMNTTLSVYLRDAHGVPDQGFGYILSLNAGMVVIFQLWITRRIKHFPPMIIMALGALLYAVGFSMYGFVSTFALFMVAMIIITIGEMFVAPVGQALAANFAPENMRGRYLATFGFSWAIPTAFAPWIAGLIMDNYDPNWVWYLCGIVSMVAVMGYLLLHFQARERFAEING